jgi:hypothetical protein
VILTETSDYEGNEVPCLGADQFPDVKTRRDPKERDEHHCRCKGGIIVVKFEVAVVCSHDIGFASFEMYRSGRRFEDTGKKVKER